MYPFRPDVAHCWLSSNLSAYFLCLGQGCKDMTVYTRKQRRRMHAIPAGIAVLMLAILWLFSNYSNADVLLDASHFEDWKKDCRRCVIEAQYDVLQGEVIYLQADMGTATLSNPYDHPGAQPLLNWRWSLDQTGEPGSAFTVTAFLHDDASGRDFRLHYVWDSSAETDTRQTLAVDEYTWVVCGSECGARRWYDVERDPVADLMAVSGEPLNTVPVRFRVALGRPGDRKADASGFLQSLAISYRPAPVPSAPVVTND